MAPTLLQRLFNKRGGGAAPGPGGAAKAGAALSWSCSELDLSEIRLIVYQDCERRGRQVLFDSKAVQKIEAVAAQEEVSIPLTPQALCATDNQVELLVGNRDRSQQWALNVARGRVLKAGDVPGRMSARSCQASSSVSSCSSSGGSSHLEKEKEQLPKYQYTRPASDVSMLGEMMFGSVAMSYKGSTLKIHYIRSPPQLMISKVFSARMGSFCGSTNNLQDSFEYINQDPHGGKLNTNQNSLGACRTGSNLGLLQGVTEGGPLRLTRSASFFAAHSTPVDMPSRGQNEDRDSGIARSASLQGLSGHHAVWAPAGVRPHAGVGAEPASLSSLLITPLPSPGSSTSSSSSYQRRWLRSQMTSLENGVIPRRGREHQPAQRQSGCSFPPRKRQPCGPDSSTSTASSVSWRTQGPEDRESEERGREVNKRMAVYLEGDSLAHRNSSDLLSSRSTDETFSLAEETCNSNPAMVRRKKIAISIIFTLCEKEEAQQDFQDFFFSHFPLFESHMNRLKSAIEKAMISCRKIAESSLRVQAYVSRLMEALGEFRGTIWNLYSVPRVADPVWLAMMASTSERSQLCQRFLKEFTLLIEHINKNQFLAALLTAVLTYHLAWVPTVMPIDHPSVRASSEKRASQSVNTLAKTHPYNPLWAQLGDLYGALGSPVRLTRTVVVGKQKDLVQRILYVLTYFLRCSELQDNQLTWGGHPAEGGQAVSGSKIVTALEKGEVEESEYVVVTVRNEPALVPPVLPPVPAERRGPGTTGSAGAPHGGVRPVREGSRRQLQSSTAGSRGLPGPALDGVSCGAGDGEKAAPPAGSSAPACCEGPGARVETGPQIAQEMDEEVPQKLPAWSSAWPCPDRWSRGEPPAEKVTFHIGSSASPESDSESRTRKMDERLKGCGWHPDARAAASVAWDRQASGCSCRAASQRGVGCPQTQPPDPGEGEPRRGGAEDRCTGTDTAMTGAAAGQLHYAGSLRMPPSPASGTGRTPEKARALHLKTAEGPPQVAALDQCVLQGSGLPAAADAPCGGASGKAGFRVEGDIPRNESSDSALGDSDDEACAAAALGLGHSGDRTAGPFEVELPLPRSQSISSPNVRNFGRSLLAGYCPTYMPDLVLHGTSTDEKLRQCLLADLAHTVHHPVLDEPIAEAVCIIADTDKWSVQVATSQRKVTDSTKLGQDVLVSSQVSSLLQSILQLYKLHLPADFCIMHLEDRLQELYLKSKMLSEYLRGHTRVHVKELGVVLGIESNDLPLLTAVASTHSPHVAQILL